MQGGGERKKRDTKDAVAIQVPYLRVVRLGKIQELAGKKQGAPLQSWHACRKLGGGKD